MLYSPPTDAALQVLQKLTLFSLKEIFFQGKKIFALLSQGHLYRASSLFLQV